MQRAVSATWCRAPWFALLLALNCSSGSQSADNTSPPSPDGVGSTRDEPSTGASAGESKSTTVTGGGGTFSIETSSEQPAAAPGSGAAAQAGQAGGVDLGGAGATGTAGASNGGHAGVSGAAGSVGNASGGAKKCTETCARHQDCQIDGQDRGFRCNALTKRCEKPGSPCVSATECLPNASLWFWDCTAQSDCFYFSDDVCVSVAGSGKCAHRAPGGSAASSGCESPTPDAVLLLQLGSEQSVLVCANASDSCEAGACVPACHADGECTPARNGSVCDLASGVCRCVKDDDCGGAGVSHCNSVTGICECGSDADCKELPNSDLCVNGSCSCSSAAACKTEPVFSGTSFACQ